MTTEYIRQIIKNGEEVDVELKESKTNLNKNIFQTVCSFLNRNGGHLILGINDNGNILGINNPEKLITEGDIFKIIIAIPKATMQAPMQAIMQVENHDERTVQIIEFCKLPKTREEVQTFLNLKNRDYFRKEILNPLLEQGILQMTIPEKPNSPKQKYYSTIREDNQDD